MRFSRLCAVKIPGVIGLLAAMTARSLAAPQPRQRILLDDGWRFHLAATPDLKSAVSIRSWRWKFDDSAPADADEMAATDLDVSGDAWHTAQSGDDIFRGRVGFAWLRVDLPAESGPRITLRFQSVDDNATVYLNGRKLLYHTGWNDPFEVPLDSAWSHTGANHLAILVENTNGPGGIRGPVTLGRETPLVSGDPSRPQFNDSKWRVVHLPHDYVVEQKFTPTADAGHGSLPTPAAWYRRRFFLPRADRGKSIWIDFDGVYRDAVVYLNGVKLGEHPSGYTSFRYDIGKLARFGDANTLAVHVDPHHFEGWWYEGGGIYRHVWLNTANPIHIAPWGTYVTTSLPEPAPGAAPHGALVKISTTILSSGASGNCSLATTITDDTGRPVGRVVSAMEMRGAGRQTVAQQVTVSNPRLWSIDHPRLYRLAQEVLRGGRPIDAEDTTFGIRTILFDKDKGFFLNGKPLKILGTCNHQDFAGIGIAVPDNMEYWRVKKLKEMGANAWRMSHNPPTPSLLDACDRLGMLVMDENRHLGDTYSDHSPGGTPASNLSDLASMILRDRNHPSVIMWSMCNEEGLEGSPEGAKIFAAMVRVVHKYDRSRPISCAMNGGWFGNGFRDVEDLMGV
ncbi:MAG TPA: glycoside hydrolase family 2 TIM barrel-domain containing protein, partial [Chthonomonadales bacterium]|nr:glycoside hydrolase family 2 TIM barrel-domain containing protein [Chthonomonadales bacterium]